MSTTAHLFTQTDGTTNFETVFAQNAAQLNNEILSYDLGKSAWVNLTQQGEMLDGQGFTASRLVYDQVLPNTATNSSADASTIGANWVAVGGSALASQTATGSFGQVFAGTYEDTVGPADGRAYLHFNRLLQQGALKTTNLFTPMIDINDVRYAANGIEQVAEFLRASAESVRWTWEERRRDEYDRVCANLVPCLATGTPIVTTIDVSAGTKFEGTQTVDVDLNNDFVTSGVDVDYTPTNNISNKILNVISHRMMLMGGDKNAWGMRDNVPQHVLICSPEASETIKYEPGYREDMRESPIVDELLKPFGATATHRNFFHVVDLRAPRFTVSGGTLTRVRPETMTNGVPSYNAAYDSATHELAYVLHKEVMKSLMPKPLGGIGALKFDAITHKGDFAWCNIKDAVINPRGTNGFLHALLSDLTLPGLTRLGYAVLFKRNTAPAT
jgi:hypothetical protein